MEANTLTLALEGEVGLQGFSSAMRSFSQLVQALSREIANDASVKWVVEQLDAGSAVATVRGYSETSNIVPAIVKGFYDVGKAMQTGAPIPYSDRVRRSALDLTRVISEEITAVRLETAFGETIIAAPSLGARNRGLVYAYGRIVGIVETLSRRRGLKFTLYDLLFDRAISCYLSKGQENLMRNAWGNLVAVSGRIGRNPDDGRPVLVRDIVDIEILERPAPGAYRQARNAIPYDPDAPAPEEIIRGLRDA